MTPESANFDFFSSADPSATRPRVKPFTEFGRLGTYVYSGYIYDREQNPKLAYLQRNLRYEELVSNTAIIGAGVRYITALCASAEWSVEPAEEDKDEFHADFVRRMMDSIDQSWTQVVEQAITHYWYGFSVQEWTANKEDDGAILFKSIEPRPQRTLWQFDLDELGTVRGFGQRLPVGGKTLYIPREKTLYIVDDVLTDSPVGLGVLRHVFETCERLKNYLDIEYASYARDLRGIPVGRAPFAELQKAVKNGEIAQADAETAVAAMESLMKSSKKLPDTAIILDSSQYISKSDTGLNVSAAPMWDLEILQGNGQGFVDIDRAINRLQTEIARVLSVENLLLSGGGSQALSADKSKRTFLTANGINDHICSRVRNDLLKPLWALNGFDTKFMPKFKVEEINDRSAEETAKILKDLAASGAMLSADDPVINDIRSALGVTLVDLNQKAREMAGV